MAWSGYRPGACRGKPWWRQRAEIGVQAIDEGGWLAGERNRDAPLGMPNAEVTLARRGSFPRRA